MGDLIKTSSPGVPASGGTPGSPGSPAHPAYCIDTLVTTDETFPGGIVFVYDSSGNIIGYMVVPAYTAPVTRTEHVCYPASTGTPPTPGTPAHRASPPDRHPGWSASAIGIVALGTHNGRYYFSGQVAWATASGGQFSAGLRVNSGGTVWRGTRATPPTTSSQGLITTVEQTLRMSAGDYVELIAAQSSSGTVALNTTAPAYSKLIALWRGA